VIAYLDASVLLRFALGQPDALPEWRQIERGVSSALIRTESLRALDRLRLRANLADAEVAKRRATVLAVIASLEGCPRSSSSAHAYLSWHPRCHSPRYSLALERNETSGSRNGNPRRGSSIRRSGARLARCRRAAALTRKDRLVTASRSANLPHLYHG